MPDFLIRDLDEYTMRRLKARAEESGRSLQAEIRETLQGSVRMSRDELRELFAGWRARDEGREYLDAVETIRRHRDA